MVIVVRLISKLEADNLETFWHLYYYKQMLNKIYSVYADLHGIQVIDVGKKMAACTFYQNALLRTSRVNDWIKMTRNHLMMTKFNTTKKLTSCLMAVLQKTSIRFFNKRSNRNAFWRNVHPYNVQLPAAVNNFKFTNLFILARKICQNAR
jgi:hypothetical protein